MADTRPMPGRTEFSQDEEKAMRAPTSRWGSLPAGEPLIINKDGADNYVRARGGGDLGFGTSEGTYAPEGNYKAGR